MITNILIRVDGNATIGHGHLVRCTALAQMLDKMFPIRFVCHEVPETVENDIRNKGWEILRTEDEVSWLQAAGNNSIVVLDGYHFGTALQRAVKATGALLVCIDDTHDIPFVADLVLNHTQGICATDYRGSAATQYATGFDYALLRKEFTGIKETQVKEQHSLFICFGGSDSRNITQLALEEVQRFDVFKTIYVVTGSSYTNAAAINTIAENDSRVTHYTGISANEMRNLMLRSEIAIVPSSGVLMEALACGCRIISGIYADNQKLVYAGYKAQQIFTDAGHFTAQEIRLAIEKTLQDNRMQHPVLIDGLSGERIAKLFAQLSLSSRVVLRPATLNDTQLTYSWAADPVVRSFSFNTRPIIEEEHINWFAAKLNNNNCRYYIAELDGKPAGSIRFDLHNGEALISYLVSPELHGKGLGQILLGKGLEKISQEPATANHCVTGYVLPGNIASLKAFRRFAFTETQQDGTHKFEMQLHDSLI